ncbi:MAG: hypothetical protein RLZZ468_866, partial [Cyanobacteriota bacterium]
GGAHPRPASKQPRPPGPPPRRGGAGHRLAGHNGGVVAGLAGLFAGRPWVATPDAATDSQALAAVRTLATTVGARWLTCGAGDHDQAVALISHLPVLVSAALLQAADRPLAPAALVRELASSGFADTTRVGGGNPELGTLMARCNQPAVLAALEAYRQQLEVLEQRVRQGDWDGLRQILERSAQLRPPFVQVPDRPAAPPESLS